MTYSFTPSSLNRFFNSDSRGNAIVAYTVRFMLTMKMAAIKALVKTLTRTSNVEDLKDWAFDNCYSSYYWEYADMRTKRSWATFLGAFAAGKFASRIQTSSQGAALI